MKTIYILLIISAVLLMQSCYEPGDIRIQNKITNVKLTDVRWGDHYIAYELLPGETTVEVTIERDQEKLPSKHQVSFIMTANGKSIYLETREQYYLDEGGDLFVVLTDTTKVVNPNE